MEKPTWLEKVTYRNLRGALPKGVVVIPDPLDAPVCSEYPQLTPHEAQGYPSHALEAARIVTNGPDWKA